MMNVLAVGHNKKQGALKQLSSMALRRFERRVRVFEVGYSWVQPAGLATDKLESDSQLS
jgi:hypothetical protein